MPGRRRQLSLAASASSFTGNGLRRSCGQLKTIRKHEIGFLKPARDIYGHVVADLRCDSWEIAFFDDTERNVEGARAAGMLGFRVDGIEALRAALRHVCGDDAA
ncbi:MAG: HAD-IA family hydrolase [Burkholderiales bacterium]